MSIQASYASNPCAILKHKPEMCLYPIKGHIVQGLPEIGNFSPGVGPKTKVTSKGRSSAKLEKKSGFSHHGKTFRKSINSREIAFAMFEEGLDESPKYESYKYDARNDDFLYCDEVIDYSASPKVMFGAVDDHKIELVEAIAAFSTSPSNLKPISGSQTEFLKLGTRDTGLTIEQQVKAFLLPYPGEKPESYFNVKPISQQEIDHRRTWW